MNILITGASSAVGIKLSNLVAEQKDDSWRIILSSRSSNADLSELQSTNIKYVGGIDLLKQDDIEVLAKESASFFAGPFNISHSVGEFLDRVPFTGIKTERAKNIMDSHYTTLYGLLQHLIPVMIGKGGGRVLAFSCNSVRYNYPHMASFTAAKAALEALVKSIANEYAMNNIIANALELSSIQSEVDRQSKPHGDFEHYLPLETIAETVLKILDMSSIVNGAVVNCFSYSHSFFNEGYFSRNRKEVTKKSEIY